jgi:hypothetical protein
MSCFMLTEEERKCDIVLNASHPKILNHALNFRVAYISPVDMGHQIEQLLMIVYQQDCDSVVVG